MKYFIYLFTIFVICSCNNDDDSTNKNDDDNFISVDLNKSFLIGEKWFLDSAISNKEVDFNGDGNKDTNLTNQVESCVNDNFYIFEQNEPDLVVINDSNIVCDNFFDQYGAGVFDFSILADVNKLGINASQFDLLGGFKNVFFIDDVEFLISKDSSFKIIKGTIQNNIDQEDVTITYFLIARADNRP